MAPTLGAVSLRRALFATVTGALLAGCAGGSAGSTTAPVSSASTAASTVTPTASPVSLPSTPAPRAVPQPAFRWHSASVAGVTLGRSWRPGCPVGPSGLRAVTLTTWGFDRHAHAGTLIVATHAVPAVVAVFRRLYAARFPIRRMVPIAAYGGSDDRSMAADNTSAFNCRAAVSDGPKTWSMHAYGLAVDLDPLENPYTLNGRVYPPAGAPYTDRSRIRRGMIVPRGPVVAAFSAVGWGWGGRWSSSPDLQHFSVNGK